MPLLMPSQESESEIGIPNQESWYVGHPDIMAHRFRRGAASRRAASWRRRRSITLRRPFLPFFTLMMRIWHREIQHSFSGLSISLLNFLPALASKPTSRKPKRSQTMICTPGQIGIQLPTASYACLREGMRISAAD